MKSLSSVKAVTTKPRLYLCQIDELNCDCFMRLSCLKLHNLMKSQHFLSQTKDLDMNQVHSALAVDSDRWGNLGPSRRQVTEIND